MFDGVRDFRSEDSVFGSFLIWVRLSEESGFWGWWVELICWWSKWEPVSRRLYGFFSEGRVS